MIKLTKHCFLFRYSTVKKKWSERIKNNKNADIQNKVSFVFLLFNKRSLMSSIELNFMSLFQYRFSISLNSLKLFKITYFLVKYNF